MQDARVPRAEGLLALSTTMTSAVLAATALIMGGTGHPLSVRRTPQPSLTIM
jgi:hypothetical protein